MTDCLAKNQKDYCFTTLLIYILIRWDKGMTKHHILSRQMYLISVCGLNFQTFESTQMFPGPYLSYPIKKILYELKFAVNQIH